MTQEFTPTLTPEQMCSYLFIKFMDVSMDFTPHEGKECVKLFVNQMVNLKNQPDDFYHYWYMVGEYGVNL